MRYLASLLILAFVPAATAAPYAVFEDPEGDQAPFATEKFDIVQVAVDGDEHNITLSVTMADDVREQRGQHAVAVRGSGFHVHVACYIGQTSPVSDDPVECSAADAYQEEGDLPAGFSDIFSRGPPVFSDDGRTWSYSFNRTDGGVPVGATTDRIYAQSKMSVRDPVGSGETSPGAAGYSEADNGAWDEYVDLGAPQEPAADAPAAAPASDDRDVPLPGVAPLLAGLAAMAMIRRMR